MASYFGKPPPPPKLGGHYVQVGNNWQLIHAVGPNQWAPGPVKGGTAPSRIPMVAAPQPVKTPAATPSVVKPPAAQQPSALDDTYFGNVAQNQFNVNQKQLALGQQSAASTQALNTALNQLAYQQPRDQLALEQAANRRGALYSTVYGQQSGDLGLKYATQRTGQIDADAARQTGYQQQGKALSEGIPIYNQRQALQSALRQAALDAKNPATGQPLSVPVTPQPAAPKAGGHYVQVGNQWRLIHAVGPNQWAPGPVPKATTPTAAQVAAAARAKAAAATRAKIIAQQKANAAKGKK